MCRDSSSLAVSVVIPTYNRIEIVQSALRSLCAQTLPASRLQVVLVDDGSPVDICRAIGGDYPFDFVCLRQPNQGATQARNFGAAASRGEILIFMDDDIEPDASTLEALLAGCQSLDKSIILGNLVMPHAREHSDKNAGNGVLQEDVYVPVHFSHCMTGLLAVRRDVFLALGMFRDPTGGWPNWDDVDFGYRAHLAGYKLVRNMSATAVHHDAAAATMSQAARRWWMASKSAVRLFQMYPDILCHFPMFHDKTKIEWQREHPKLTLRKITRKLSSTVVGIWVLESLATILQKYRLSPRMLGKLRIWVYGAYMYRGFCEGLREYGPINHRQ